MSTCFTNMKLIKNVLTLLGAAVLLSSCDATDGLNITSPAFSHDELIPTKYSCEGIDVNPELNIASVPENAKSLALIMHDPDAPMDGGFTHWVMWNISTEGNIPEAYTGAQQGINTSGSTGYVGMCPPEGKHHYHYYVYALDTELDLPPSTDKQKLEQAMEGHILSEGRLTGLYQKENIPNEVRTDRDTEG